MGNRNYMHKGKITRNDVLAEVFTVEQSHGYPNDGWRHDGYEITLIGLAEIWAEQENEKPARRSRHVPILAPHPYRRQHGRRT